MLDALFSATSQDILRVGISTAAVFVAVITYTRIAGLRSFSKMSGFDFAMTVAVGSLMATTAVAQVTLIEGLVALALLYVIQVLIALLRRHKVLRQVIDNQPVLLLKNGKFLHGNMKESRITHGDILSKLREANIADINKVQAVVLETTGDISVLSGNEKIDAVLLDGVKE